MKSTINDLDNEGRPLIEEFKRGMNGGIRRKLMEVENPPASIEQWYKRATALDRNWRESRREEERLRGKKEMMGGAPKQEQKQNLPRLLVWQRRQPLPQQATTGPAPMEGIERMNTVVVRGGIVMLVEALGTWPDIAEIGVREEEWWRIGKWNMVEGELRRL